MRQAYSSNQPDIKWWKVLQWLYSFRQKMFEGFHLSLKDSMALMMFR